MFNDDTIAAISTPLGEGGIGIIRLSGKDSVSIVEKIFYSPKNRLLKDIPSHKLLYGFIKDPLTGEKIDEVLVTIMRSPYSYTKEDVVEINCHGGMLPLRKTLELVLKEGARLAEPGEFTKRAFINGRLDLSQAEAVLDLIKAKTDESRKIALQQLQGNLSQKISILRDTLKEICANIEAYIDFPEDDIETTTIEELRKTMKDVKVELLSLLKTYEEARFFREGLSIAIIGRPNVGKSSLLNALLSKDRAIVTPVPGTTRDLIEEYLNIKGLPVRIMDTAGIRKVKDIAEKEGVKRSLNSIENADLIIAVFDGSEQLNEEDSEVLDKIKDKNTLIVINKCDLPSVLDESDFSPYFSSKVPCILRISATRGDGIEELKSSIFDSFLNNWKEVRDGVIVTNIRHKISLENALSALDRAISGLQEDLPIEIVAFEIRDSLDRLGEIIGAVTTEDIIDSIFKNFCIGK
ncbi:MAG: tRNA uridine-5-carboxymethylaminomethyl(34) synthesis GTPase MnmE [Thermodesulfovibrionales bacterium]